ncbi:cyclic 2,3-diphosphoglycerate synthase [Desulfosediminicola ganghwensis]|uniref:cyclic 2,3-diphosphoglycerate synthase n=1 Tax=Desulfosediminicola ganghwensis TaxID=2569540 RepID=UPI0010AC327E|nr:cyclic 2,3-diphosphoglycerate synthase [Desulfosediminicola ganghwensis]
MIENVIIMGAAGRDFHNFNVYFKDNSRYRVVAFTAAQIPNIEGRSYPPELAGKMYPAGIPIRAEAELAGLIRENSIDLVAFSYSDVPYSEVMHKASIAMAENADFIMIGARYTMLKSAKPVIAVCAVRTGCGKSPTTRKICELLAKEGKKTVVVRHPMPYGDLRKQEVQRFSSYQDFGKMQCTIEEREEYEPLVDLGITVFAGIDYEKILRAAETEADIIIWDGGNNDTPFFAPDVHIVLFDPHRAGHELLYYPGETNMIMADIAIINKVNTAQPKNIDEVRHNIERHAPKARIILAESEISVNRPERIRGRRVLVVEDGPTLTHGGMAHGAGMIAARKHGAAVIVDPRPYAVGTLAKAYKTYPHIGPVLPAMGYSPAQVKDLETTIHNVDCDLVLFATPIKLNRLLSIDHPALRVSYTYRDHGKPDLEDALRPFLMKLFP